MFKPQKGDMFLPPKTRTAVLGEHIEAREEGVSKGREEAEL